jgi:hypothetical protein
MRALKVTLFAIACAACFAIGFKLASNWIDAHAAATPINWELITTIPTERA